MERTWTEIGEAEGLDREQVSRLIDTMEWKPMGGREGMMPAMGIVETIRQLRLPKVSRYAISGIGSMGFYGIEAHYRNGTAKVYVLDTGDAITVIVSDLEPEPAHAR